MNKTRMLTVVLVLVCSILLGASGVTAQDAAPGVSQALGTGFTYQGQLKNSSGGPVSATCALLFTLWDSLSGVSQVGSASTVTGVSVVNGYFTTQVNSGGEFGATAFNGEARWLQINVKCGSEASYTSLTPRQELTAAPYAMLASKSAAAPWSGLTGVPGGFADGTDDNTTYTAGDGLELVGTQFKGKGTSIQNVVIVAKSGGDFTTITAALNSITTASATNRFLVYVAPGEYNESVAMKAYVDIEGAGELATKITSNGSTLWGADLAELRFLTVETTGGSTYAIAIINDDASPHLTHVTAYATGGAFTYGVLNRNNSYPTMTNITVTAAGDTGGSVGYFGVYNNASYPVITNCTVWGMGGAISYGMYNEQGGATINNSVVKAGFGTNNYGIYNNSTAAYWSVVVNGSQVYGNTNSIWNDAAFSSYIATSQLGGGPVFNLGTIKCVGVYDESYYSFGYTVCP